MKDNNHTGHNGLSVLARESQVLPVIPPPVEAPSILVVDDDAGSRTALTALLQSPEYGIVAAASGGEALRQLLRHDFAVVLLDVQMPGMDGFEVARLIRQRERSRDTPIIFLTGAHIDLGSVFRGYAVGAVDYLVKPPDADALCSKVAVFVALQRASTALRHEISVRKTAEGQVRALAEDLRALAARAEQVREEERSSLSREIHDQLGQQLTALKMELKWIHARLPAGRDGLAARVDAAMHLVDETVETARRIATGLRPAISDQLGLAAAIEWQVQDFRRRSGLRCRLQLPRTFPPLDQDRATAMFRVLQELLSNVLRHAEATRVTVTLQARAGAVALVVEDNGKGMGQTLPSGAHALGFLGMQERLRPFGGTVGVEARRTSGARVTATIPLAEGNGFVETSARPVAESPPSDRVQAPLKRAGTALARSVQGATGEGSGEPLSSREMEVLRMVAAGQANKVIASALGISVRTVEVHRSRILHKTGARSMLELALSLAGEAQKTGEGGSHPVVD